MAMDVNGGVRQFFPVRAVKGAFVFHAAVVTAVDAHAAGVCVLEPQFHGIVVWVTTQVVVEGECLALVDGRPPAAPGSRADGGAGEVRG